MERFTAATTDVYDTTVQTMVPPSVPAYIFAPVERLIPLRGFRPVNVTNGWFHQSIMEVRSTHARTHTYTGASMLPSRKCPPAYDQSILSIDRYLYRTYDPTLPHSRPTRRPSIITPSIGSHHHTITPTETNDLGQTIVQSVVVS